MNPQQSIKNYLDSVYVISHSYNSVKSYKFIIINKNDCGFRDYLQEQYQIDELEFVEQTKQEKFDVYVVLRDFITFLDKLNYKS